MTEELSCLPAVAFGACRICFAITTAFSRRGSATQAATRPTQLIAIMEHMPKRSKSSSILRGSATDRSSSSSSRFTIRPRAIAKGTTSGPSYRSAIFYTTDEQRRIAEDTFADVDESGLWPGKVVTELAPAGDFWEAEPEHQDYLLRNPGGYTCHSVRPHWRLPIRKSKGTKLA